MVTVYLVRCLGAKLERSKVYVTGIIVTFMYLVIQSLMTDFEGAGIFVGLMVSKDFLRIVEDKDARYYVTTVLAQVFLAMFITIIVKMEARTKTFLKDRFIILALAIPVLTICICAGILRVSAGGTSGVVFAPLAIAGLVAINVITVISLMMEQRIAQKKAADDLQLEQLQHQMQYFKQVQYI